MKRAYRFKWVQIRFGLRTAEPMDQNHLIRLRFMMNVAILKPQSLLWGLTCERPSGLLNGKKV
jgi:hypothetical protein